MSHYKKLLDYIPYFENEDIVFCKRRLGFPEYDENLREFIRETYNSDLLKSDYLDYLKDNGQDQDISKEIPSAEWEMLKSILTFYVRGERFSDGLWDTAVKEKVFLKILYRIRELGEQGSS